MDRLAVIICNYNGGTDTLRCIDSILNSTYTCLDIIVVDNASEDDSIKLLTNKYGSQIQVIQNSENLGGSGGFGRGMRECLHADYKYLILMDNDAVTDRNTIEYMYNYMEEHPTVGAAGPKIMMLDYPDRIMDYAKVLDFDNYTDKMEFYNCLEDDENRKNRECDFVAATMAIYSRKALLESGPMDESYFIYYDDIELCHRIRKHNYGIVCLGEVKAWHKSGMEHNAKNTFARYYLERNTYHFFAKAIEDDDIERFASYILDRTFSVVYGASKKGRVDIASTVHYVFLDFLSGKRGKAAPGRIRDLFSTKEPELVKFLEYEKVLLIQGGSRKVYDKLTKVIEQSRMNVEISDMPIEGKKQTIVHTCPHVRDLTSYKSNEVWMDDYGNLIKDEADYFYFRNYYKMREVFILLFHDELIRRIYEIRKKEM